MRPIDDILTELNALDRSVKAPFVRPRDAATLLVLDRHAGGPVRVLMGRRHMRHRFMPGAWVFPGGRVDAGDSRVPLADDYEAGQLARLMVDMKGPKTAARARAFAVAAIRETYEEAGLFIGRANGTAGGGDHDHHDAFAAFAAHGLEPSLAGFRFVARAITPPGRPRRFDTRFFAVPAEAIAATLPGGVGPSGELEDVAWVTFDEARARPELMPITRAMLDELDGRLDADPDLSRPLPVPFYFWRQNRFLRTVIGGDGTP